MSSDLHRARERLLDAMLEDLAAGRLGSAADYLRRFPECASIVVSEYARVRSIEDATSTTIVRSGSSKLVVAPDLGEGGSFGRFDQLHELGRGGQGVVFRARDSRLGRTVALKLVLGLRSAQPDLIARFLREAEIAALLDHPGICTIYESGVEQDIPYIAMQFLEGRSLGALLAQRDAAGATYDPRRPEGLRRVLRLIEAVARALHHAHAAGVIHRDVKPDNILVRTDGSPVVLDFGIARREGGDLPALTESGMILGTLHYMAPEQLRPRGAPLDGRADIYALGITTYQALAGRRPFDAPSFEQLYRKVLDARAPDLRKFFPELPEDLRWIVAMAMAPEPQRRYASAEAFADDLRAFLEHRPVVARPITLWLRLQRWYHRNPLAASALLFAMLSMSVGLVMSLWSNFEAQSQRALADGRRIEVERLADDLGYQELIATSAPELWRLDAPASVLRDWIARAEALVSRLPLHLEDLARLRERGRIASREETEAFLRDTAEVQLAELLRARERGIAAELLFCADGHPERASWRERAEQVAEELRQLDEYFAARAVFVFDDARDQWRENQLVMLIERLRALQGERGRTESFDSDLRSLRALRATSGSAEDGIHRDIHLPRARARLALLERIQGAQAEHEAHWLAAEQRIAADPRFRGERLKRRADLVPLGPDPETGLEEFALDGTGVIPRRDEAGALLLVEDCAIVLVLLEGGSVSLGHRDEPSEARSNEAAWDAELAPYLLGKYEVTQAQWMTIFPGNPSNHNPAFESVQRVSLLHPVESVTWVEADRFVRSLGLQLPTEAQWEAGARAGGSEERYWGEEIDIARYFENLADASLLDRVPGTICESWSDGFVYHAPIASFRQNPFGLYDMLGNVHEWVADDYLVRRSSIRARGDGRALGERRIDEGAGELRIDRVYRGASWYNTTQHARCAARYYAYPNLSNAVIGLRVALSSATEQRTEPETMVHPRTR